MPEVPSTPPLGDPPSLRVLLVEDDEANALVAGSALRLYGCAVVAVADGRAAIQSACGSEFDLVFMDFHLPGADGVTATRDIRRFERTNGRQPVAIIGLTASAMPHERQECLDAGMNDVLLKPFRFEELQRILAVYRPKLGAAP